MSAEHPIRAVSKLTGLSVDTLRAWERRYGAVVPARGDRGRVYTEADVRRLLRLRQAVDRGYAIGQVASMNDERLVELLAELEVDSDVPRTAAHPTTELPAQAAPVLDAIARFDFTRAEGELSRLASLLPTRVLVYDVILPLMRVVGDRWHRGEFSVSQEHMASAIIRNLLGSIMRLHQPAADARRILVTTPAGEIHEFGILAGAILAVSINLQVIYLGPNLPGREIIESAERIGCDVVLLGVSNPDPTPGVIEEARLVIHGLPESIDLWIGGPDPVELSGSTSRSNLALIADFETLETKMRELT